MNQTGCNLTPISRHPVAAVTAWPVAVLAVGHLVLLQLMLHLLLDLDDLPECMGKEGMSHEIEIENLGHCDQRFLKRQTRFESTARFWKSIPILGCLILRRVVNLVAVGVY